jgi:CheY-like chemotaxis protein
VDDSPHFLEAASLLIEGQGLTVVGVASTSAEAIARVRELEPDVAILDVALDRESGFDLAWQVAASSGGATTTVLTSTRSESDLAELVAVTPSLGFISKNELSADSIRDFLADRSHGHGCRHEALVYSSPDELAAGALPFLRQGLANGDHLLVILTEAGRAVVEDALGDGAARVTFIDADEWYQSPELAFDRYTHYVDDQIGRGARRVRILAEISWPASFEPSDVASWKRYEAGISGALASVPVSFVCTYDTRKLPPEIIIDARRTHPVLRSSVGARPSAQYVPPGAFIRALEHDVTELLARR